MVVRVVCEVFFLRFSFGFFDFVYVGFGMCFILVFFFLVKRRRK